jgi:competence protein ComEC
MRKPLLIFLVVSVISFVASASDTLDVYFINVGAGDAILIDCGDWEALLDAGRGYSTMNAAVLSVLAEHVDDGIIELAILSHPHADHYGGFETVLKHYEVWEFWRSMDNDPDASGTTYSRFLSSLTDEGLVPHQLERGDRFTEGTVEWTVLGPGELSTASKNDNENSLVLLLAYREVSFLFAGDIESYGEAALYDIDLPVGSRVLKIAHHGSDTSTSTEFLSWASPELAVISTKYEAPPALTNLEFKGIPYSTTSGSGTILVSTDGETIWLTTNTLSRQVLDCSDE